MTKTASFLDRFYIGHVFKHKPIAVKLSFFAGFGVVKL
jgi:hypothetical protein